MDWQSITALACVGITLVVFAWRFISPSEKSSCGSDCSCGAKQIVKPIGKEDRH